LPEVKLVELAHESDGSDDDEEHDSHDHGADASEDFIHNFALKMYSLLLALSAGVVWDFIDGYNIGLSLSHECKPRP
jgi:iron complex outermembrane recepter protein